MRIHLQLSAIVFAIQLAAAATAQEVAPLDSCPSSLLAASAELGAVYPESAAIDQRAACTAFLSIADDFIANSFATEDAAAATRSAWSTLRKDTPASESLDPNAVIMATRNHGRLIVSSRPIGAAVALGTASVACRTTCDRWLPAGTYRVIISMEGYITAEVVANVRAIQLEVISQELERANSESGHLGE